MFTYLYLCACTESYASDCRYLDWLPANHKAHTCSHLHPLEISSHRLAQPSCLCTHTGMARANTPDPEPCCDATAAPACCPAQIRVNKNTNIHKHFKNPCLSHRHTVLIHSLQNSRHSSSPFIRLNPSICNAGLYESLYGYPFVCMRACVWVCSGGAAVCDRQLNIITAAHTALLFSWPI